MLNNLQDRYSCGERTRRNFIKNVLVAGAAPIVMPSIVSAAGPASSKVKIGLIGCGARGTGVIMRAIKAHEGFELVAGADYFQDKLDALVANFGVSPKKCYSGLHGYRKLIDDGGVDAVAVISPPYFHPEQVEYSVNAGKHVYLAKPVAVDVPGCFSIEDSGMLATKKGLTFLVDFQTRASEAYIEGIKRVHDGLMGELCFGEAMYHADDPFKRAPEILGPDPNNPEARLRIWGVDRVLSGDIITEQNIHVLDVMSWIMDQLPKKAVGSCNQKVRKWGNCNDHFSVIYDFGNDVDVAFSSRQFNAFGTQPEGIKNRMFGTNGTLETDYQGAKVLLRIGEGGSYRGPQRPAEALGGVATNFSTFYNSIMAGDASNPTIAPSVRSNLVTILGREAAYSGKSLTWDQVIQNAKPYQLELDLKV